MKAVLLVLALLVALSSAQMFLLSNKNRTLSAGDGRYVFRDISIAEIGNYLSYFSRSLASNGSVRDVDAIRGVIYFPPLLGQTFPPTAWASYSSKDETILSDTQTDFDADVSIYDAFIAKTFNRLVEVDQNQNIVRNVTFASLNWVAGPILLSPDRNVASINYTYTHSGATIIISFASTRVLGYYPGNVTATPRHLESFVYIENYPYTNVNNSLTLVIHAASAALGVTGNVAYTSTDPVTGTTGTAVAGGSGYSQVYYYFSGTARVNNQTQSVTVSGAFQNISIHQLENPTLLKQLQGAGHLTVDVREIRVTFPAGASYIEYDPTAGFTDPNGAAMANPTDAPSSFGSLVVPSFLLSLFAFVLALYRF